jgi:hypothetical protein
MEIYERSARAAEAGDDVVECVLAALAAAAVERV